MIQFEARVARLSMQYGEATVKEAASLFNTSEKALLKNVDRLDKFEAMVQRLAKVNSKEHWASFKFEPAQAHKVTLNSVNEAYVAVAAEEQGVFSKLRRSSHPGADFIEHANNTLWDVKSAVSKSSTGKNIFDVDSFLSGIKHELLGKENVIVNILDLTDHDFSLLYDKLSNLDSTSLSRIVIVHAEDPAKTVIDLNKYLGK